VIPVVGWSAPPVAPTLDRGDAAVWRLPADTEKPIEAVLSRYLASKPESVVLERSETGKPKVAGAPFAVNLAHSGNAAVVVVTQEADAGIDLERLRADAGDWALVDHVLTERERARLRTLPPSELSEAFLRIWTRKEAVLKAAGIGLALDPRLVEIDGTDVVAAPPALGGADAWTLVDIPLDGYVASLAVSGSLARVLLYDPAVG
jgi:4'-phosphopantetheinyl transferase